MRILIIGEYSGFAKNLSLGLKSLGHYVLTFTWGDGFKNIKQDNTVFLDCSNYHVSKFKIRGSWRIKSLFQSFRLIFQVYSFDRNALFDIIFVINAAFLRKEYKFWNPRFSKAMLYHLLKDKDRSKIYLSACGNDYVYNSYMRNLTKISSYEISKYESMLKKELDFFSYYTKYVKKVIPICFDYAVAYRNNQLVRNLKLYKTIPLPIDVSNIKDSNNLSERIVIFHGINRPEKGTKIIMQAMCQLKDKYPNEVDILAKGRMPLDEYLKLMSIVNIVIDQCHSYSYGMNALYAMAMGKVVLSGNEPECSQEYGIDDIPVINIRPAVDQIYAELEKLILNPQSILEIGEKSRRFVEKYHDSKRIAELYISAFNN